MLLYTLVAGLAVHAHAYSQPGLYDSSTFDPLHHLAGIAPYFPPQDPETSPSPPQGCSASRAAYLIRHAAITANDFDYETYLGPFTAKLKNHTINWSTIPSLSFLSTWTSPVSSSEQEILTRVGKQEANLLGTEIALKYPNLRLPGTVWTSSAERTSLSAESLVRGLEMVDNTVNVTVIPEGRQEAANSLTPYNACTRYSSSFGSKQSSQFIQRYTTPIVKRLNASAPAFNFTSNDVYAMQQFCGYETVIRGSSPFCDLSLFSQDDWLGFEYANDIMYFYNTGYGNEYSGAIGYPWVKASMDLLMANASAQDMYLSFTHRELPPTVLVALGLYNNSAFTGANHVNATMPLDQINYNRAWKSSAILPFLTRIAIEKLNCTGSFGYADGEYYRVLVNEAPQGLPGCSDGPGTSCSRASMQSYLKGRADEAGTYSKVCQVSYANSTDVLSIYSDRTLKSSAVGR